MLFGRFQSASEMIRRNSEYVSALAYIQNNPATLPLIGKKYFCLGFRIYSHSLQPQLKGPWLLYKSKDVIGKIGSRNYTELHPV